MHEYETHGVLFYTNISRFGVPEPPNKRKRYCEIEYSLKILNAIIFLGIRRIGDKKVYV